ncbi:MAG: hypothetical protein HW407_2126 [Bacteroidetes bacterium]|nr:hypothetical protein [Bacteroidota bacterium]
MWSCLPNCLLAKVIFDGQLHINLDFKGIPAIQEWYGRAAMALCGSVYHSPV